jgi:hypothetical protein
VVEAALAGAVRLRRRRRLVRVAAAVVVALVVPVAVVAGVRVTGGERAVPATPPSPSSWPHYRDPLEVTVEVDPAAGYTVIERQAQRDRQVVTLRPADARDVVVTVHNPGTFDPKPFLAAPEEDADGRRVRYLSMFVFDDVCPTPPPPPRDGITPEDCLSAAAARQPKATPALAWAEPSGAWVVLRQVAGSNRTDLLRAAAAVRFGPPRGLRTPYRLGYVPAGFTGVYAASHQPPWPLNSVFALDPDPAVPITGLDPTNGATHDVSVALTIRVTPMTGYVGGHIADLGAPTKVAGLDTFYLTASTAGWSVEPGSAVFVVGNGHCPVFMTVRERDRVPYAELVRMVENATFTDCADPATWTAPLN